MAAPPRVALVTGGAKRVGRAICEKLAHEGFDVAFTYLSSSAEAKSLLKAIKGQGRMGLSIQADLTDPHTAINEIDKKFRATFDRLDALVNNASLYQPSNLQQTTLAMMQKFAAIHVQSPLLLCQRFAQMLRLSKGHVINMVDLLAERPWPEYLGYCTSKAALWNLTLGLARELAPEVTVNGIAPGVVEWPDNFPQGERDKYLKRVPLARSGTPDDVAKLVHFLATEGAYITGQVIRLDGGRSIT